MSTGTPLSRILVATSLVGAFACGTPDGDSEGRGQRSAGCVPGEQISCACFDGTSSTQVCLDDGTLGPCACGSSNPAAGPTATGTPAPTTTGEPPPEPTTTGEPPPPEPTMTSEPPPPEPTTTTEPPPPPPPDPSDPFDELRNACVDHINMYRATLGLAPLTRAAPDLEECADRGAEQDASTGIAHGSFGLCPSTWGQNTCPGWQTFGGEEGALTGCLDLMWDEGEPPVGRAACENDLNGCFQEHGHYLNMSGDFSTVACGFYRMPDGRIWMNQNFGP